MTNTYESFNQEEFNRTSKCDVCKRVGIAGLASSCLGPITLAYCQECLNNNAEPEWLLGFNWDSCREDVAYWVRELKTWVNDKYITYEQFESDAIANPEKWILECPDYNPRELTKEELEFNKENNLDFKCTNGHDLCNQSYPGPECPYCESY